MKKHIAEHEVMELLIKVKREIDFFLDISKSFQM